MDSTDLVVTLKNIFGNIRVILKLQKNICTFLTASLFAKVKGVTQKLGYPRTLQDMD